VSVIVVPVSEHALATIHLFRDMTSQMQYESYVKQLLHAAARLPSPPTASVSDAVTVVD